MNYRHIYHAGCVCDVVKHAALSLLLDNLCSKEKGFAVLDTHAGLGLYDLDDPRAQKTKEADEGIQRLWASVPVEGLAEYERVLRELNPASESATSRLRFYPGSPVLTRQLLRAQDRLMLCELHPDDARELKWRFDADKQVQVHHRDGYEALAALLPPPEKRGLVLIDPPFEEADEMGRLVEAVQTLHHRWPQGQAMIWYPIKERPAIWRFHEALVKSEIPKMLCAEFIYREEVRHDELNGSGFIFLNPPWQFEAKLSALFSVLHQVLKISYRGCVVKWLTGASF